MPPFIVPPNREARAFALHGTGAAPVCISPLSNPPCKVPSPFFPPHHPRRKGPSMSCRLLPAPRSHQTSPKSLAPASLRPPAASSTGTFPGTFGRRSPTQAVPRISLKFLLPRVWPTPSSPGNPPSKTEVEVRSTRGRLRYQGCPSSLPVYPDRTGSRQGSPARSNSSSPPRA